MRQREVMVDLPETSTTSPRRFRFTLWTMFIALTMAASAVWLFMEYAGFVGLFFAITVLSAAWRVLRGNKAEAAGYLAIFAIAWVALQFFGPYTTLRNRVVWVIGTERLQEWAVEVLDDPPPVDADGMALLDPDSVPEDIRTVVGVGSQYMCQTMARRIESRCGTAGDSTTGAFTLDAPVTHRTIPISTTGSPMGSGGSKAAHSLC
jgi:hypothetical protein